MKNKISILVLLLFGFTTFFTNCSKEDAATTGGLVIKVQLDGSTGFLTGAASGLATSENNLSDGIYLQDIVTDADGKADFGQLNPGNYFYDAEKTVAGTYYYADGQVQVVAGTDLELTLIIL